ncbi:hypothetical protein LTR91_003155 [Friedmanniomyces endolithicus]|uniref:Uncharacterized protein n=1 Tax=Friedmanniomyces endolithicus TaxID=329885 RepID=A0AAN6KZN2_9PEZI|nr:hypothetical protein LTR01_008699 [Friedmanniomyces endolithicus]KAK1008087.1 hypothetical protein LTR91_003155 [Friedmanniomyces endolithicus]
MAYDKYQEHKAEKHAHAQISTVHSDASRDSSLSVRDTANGDESEKADVGPPSYEDAVVAFQRGVPREAEVFVHGKEGWVKVYDEVESMGAGNRDLEIYHKVSERSGNHVAIAEAAGSVSLAELKEDWRSKWQRKKAERAVLRAERRALGGECVRNGQIDFGRVVMDEHR